MTVVVVVAAALVVVVGSSASSDENGLADNIIKEVENSLKESGINIDLG